MPNVSNHVEERYSISVLDKVRKPGVASIDSADGRFQHELDYHEASSPRSDRSLVLDLASPLYYPSSKSRIYDRSPYGNHGTIYGATWKRLPSGLWVLDFDGNDDYIVIPDASSLNSTSAFTLKVWIKQSGSTGFQYILSKFAAAHKTYNLHMRNTGEIWLQMGDGVNWFSSKSQSTYDDDIWHQVIGTWAGGDMDIFIDGREIIYAVHDTTATYAPAVGIDLYIGVIDPALGNDYDGLFALPSIYNRALNALEIQDIFNREKHLFGV